MTSVRADGRAASPPAGSSRVKEWPPVTFTVFIFQRQFGIEVHQRDGDESRVVRKCRFLRRSRHGFHPEHKNFRQHCAAPWSRAYPLNCQALASADVMAITKWSI